jgi:predicted nucleic acid-binding protein
VTNVRQALDSVEHLFFDTMPFIYYVEESADYLSLVEPFFEWMNSGRFSGYTSVLTLTEVLAQPIKKANSGIQAAYSDLLFHSKNLTLIDIGDYIAEDAARLRAMYDLKTPDALQIASALATECQAFLTNDKQLRRVTEIRVLVLDDLEL